MDETLMSFRQLVIRNGAQFPGTVCQCGHHAANKSHQKLSLQMIVRWSQESRHRSQPTCSIRTSRTLLERLTSRMLKFIVASLAVIPAAIGTVRCHSFVNTTSGLISGHPASNISSVIEYLGIPWVHPKAERLLYLTLINRTSYAQPPLGDLRFAAPQPYSNQAHFNASTWVSSITFAMYTYRHELSDFLNRDSESRSNTCPSEQPPR
jgi:hypothetical protein